jgi:Secretion system C-terminal sorting domain
LKITIPDDLPEGNDYRIRVIASDNEVSSSSYLTPLIGSASPTATFDSTTYFFKEGRPVNIKMNLTGTAPWAIKFGIDESTARSYFGIEKSPFVVQVNPTTPTTYKLFSVNSEYCSGKITGSNTVKLELITANEELADLEIKLFPNPTSDKITIQSDNFKNTTLQFTDVLGKQILQQNVTKSETILDLSNYSSGQYFLQLERDNKRVVYKIIKL